MMKNNEHITPPTMEEILNSITNKELRKSVVERLMRSTLIDDEIIGVKLFLEDNAYDFQKLQSFLQSSEENIDLIAKSTKSTKKNFGWLKIAAVLVPIIGVSMYFSLNTDNQYDNLYNKYYQKELGLPVTLSDDHKKLFNESMNLFRNEEFNSSLKGFQELLIDEPKNDTLHYFVGVCLLETGKIEESIKAFSVDFEGNIYKEKSQYLQALAYLKIRRTKEARKILIEISRSKSHRYYTQSQELLQDKLFN